MPGGPSYAATGVREGDIVAGKYRIEKILGAGGMGVVVAAHHSPEQLTASRDVDARSDIWSLGVILYELLTARAQDCAG